MNPEEKQLIERTLELSLENNRMLYKIQRNARWGRIWGLIKFLIIVIPLVIGFLYLEPHIRAILENLNAVKEILPALDAVLPR